MFDVSPQAVPSASAPARTTTRTPCWSIGLIGPGHVGAALLAQLAAARRSERPVAAADLEVRAVADSRCMWLADNGMHDLPREPRALDMDDFVDHVANRGRRAILVDCTASEAVARRYAGWLRRGVHVVTPNKRAFAGSLARWAELHAAAAKGNAQLHHETTVGAGLPVLKTLRELLDTGDELVRIEGVLSGSLSWLFANADLERPFSEWVREAAAQGLTEPDPREDLGGADVVRKLVILAREAGLALSADDVEADNLVPPALRDVSREEFMQRLPELDADMAQRLAAARAKGKVLRWVASVDAGGRARSGLAELDSQDAVARLVPGDNLVRFVTRRYDTNPLQVSGPGAGPEVTAAGVFADLLRVVAAEVVR